MPPLPATRIREFLKLEYAGSLVLLAATAAALLWVNTGGASSYDAVWGADLGLELRAWVNEGLMAVFFFVVGLEIKQELVSGELRDPRRAVLPVVAALGGMVVPALLYLALARGDASAGWGIPMATDIAFAVGVLGLLGSRVPGSARVFLLTLAIVDDIGAIIVIAVFYAGHLHLGWLLAALALVGLGVVVRRRGVESTWFYASLALAVWFATHQSGVHATLAGVALALLTPSNAIADRWQAWLHPLSSYVVLPVFALANAGIDLRGSLLADAMSSSVDRGIVVGLVLGKPVGIVLASAIAVGIGAARLPEGIGWRQLAGIGAIAGVGFTVSLFIAGLSFPGSQELTAQAKAGILAGSVLAAVIGAGVLVSGRGPSSRS